MVIITCVDDNFGLAFNNRRQASDVRVVEKILNITKGKNLYTDEYSAFMFPASLRITDIDRLGYDDFYFKELEVSEKLIKKAEKIILFKWNRVYPSDSFIDIKNFKFVNKEEFKGNSHDLITMEVYER